MMDFQPPARPPKAESIVPMINVVFLLLIFFLMTAQIAPPEPFEVAAPQAGKAGDPKGEVTLYLSAEGLAQYQDQKGEAAFAALKAELGGSKEVVLRADAKAQGARLAEVMAELRRAGFSAIELVVDLK